MRTSRSRSAARGVWLITGRCTQAAEHCHWQSAHSQSCPWMALAAQLQEAGRGPCTVDKAAARPLVKGVSTSGAHAAAAVARAGTGVPPLPRPHQCPSWYWKTGLGLPRLGWRTGPTSSAHQTTAVQWASPRVIRGVAAAPSHITVVTCRGYNSLQCALKLLRTGPSRARAWAQRHKSLIRA